MRRTAEWWDRYFLGMAQYVSTASKDPSTQCGAVIVRPDLTIASTGFNGFPKRCDDADELYEDRETKYSRVIHAEMNAILHAKEPLNGCVIFVYPIPTCDRCAAHIIQTGIKQVVYQVANPESEARWADTWKSAQKMYKEARVNVRSYV